MIRKVLVDTNVVISAAVKFSVSALGLEKRHHFHDQSSKLFEAFKKKEHLKIGIVTATVQRESFKVLVQAVMNELDDDEADVQTRQTILDSATALVDICQENMENLLSSLSTEICDESTVASNLIRVEDMCRDLAHTATNYMSPDWIDAQARRRASYIGPVTSRFRNPIQVAAYLAYKTQLRTEAIQYSRFLLHGPGIVDKTILAEAVCILTKYRKEDAGAVIHIASCDTGFFSPVRLKGGVMSRPVTDAISMRLAVYCDWPYAVAPVVEGTS